MAFQEQPLENLRVEPSHFLSKTSKGDEMAI